MKHYTLLGDSDAKSDRRQRVGLALRCEVRQGNRPWKTALLDDLSPGGFRIASMPDARAEVPLRIRIPGIQLLSARICWTRDAAIGCEFAEPLHLVVFEHIVRSAQSG